MEDGVLGTKITDLTLSARLFLALTGAQEVALWVCPSVRPSVIMLNSALNLHDIMQQS